MEISRAHRRGLVSLRSNNKPMRRLCSKEIHKETIKQSTTKISAAWAIFSSTASSHHVHTGPQWSVLRDFGSRCQWKVCVLAARSGSRWVASNPTGKVSVSRWSSGILLTDGSAFTSIKSQTVLEKSAEIRFGVLFPFQSRSRGSDQSESALKGRTRDGVELLHQSFQTGHLLAQIVLLVHLRSRRNCNLVWDTEKIHANS